MHACTTAFFGAPIRLKMHFRSFLAKPDPQNERKKTAKRAQKTANERNLKICSNFFALKPVLLWKLSVSKRLLWKLPVVNWFLFSSLSVRYQIATRHYNPQGSAKGQAWPTCPVTRWARALGCSGFLWWLGCRNSGEFFLVNMHDLSIACMWFVCRKR